MYFSNVIFSCGTLDATVDKYTVTVNAELTKLTENSEVEFPQFTHMKYFPF